jgi:hypothetical protein
MYDGGDTRLLEEEFDSGQQGDKENIVYHCKAFGRTALLLNEK